jgi:DNA-directed RNA polymerase subunit H (RpoH/RPB5)
MSSLAPGLADILIRSRFTILDILKERGYDTTPYQDISPSQLVMLASGEQTLNIIVKKSDSANPPPPCERAAVCYFINNAIRTRMDTFLRDFFDVNEKVTQADDILIILNEPYNEIFDKSSLLQWQNSKIRMRFFHIKQLVVNPSKHVLVPPHRKLTSEEAAEEIKRLHIKSKAQFPLIKHSDIQSRILGLVPGDLVEVLRPSPTAGIARVLRICVA